MAIFGYTLVPQDGGLPKPTPVNYHEGSKVRIAFGRARARYALIVAALFFIIFFFGLWGSSTESDDVSSLRAAAKKVGWFTDGFIPAKWCNSPQVSANYTPVSEENQWMKGSGRADLTFDTPFNPDDLTMTEDECDAFFPDLYKEIDRSIDYFTTKQE